MRTARGQGSHTLKVKPPEKNTLTRQVTSLLTEEIVSRRLPPDALLPKGEALAEQLGVSRMVIRESLRMLAALGLVDVRHGVGVYVNPPEAWQVEEPLSLLLRAERRSLMQWWEVRSLFEVGVVRLAAMRATDEDLSVLTAASERMHTGADYDEVVLADLDFHLGLAAATGNPMASVLMGPILKPMREHLLAAVRLPGRLDQSIAEHEAIAKAVSDRDPERAAALMERHLSGVADEITALHGDLMPQSDGGPGQREPMTTLTVLVAEDVGEANLGRLRRTFPNVLFVVCLDPVEALSMAPEADIIFTKRLPPEVLLAASRLRWVQAGVSGVERMLAGGLREREVVLTNARGAHGVPIAELIISMMLAFATGLHTLVRAQGQRARVFEAVIARKFEIEGQHLCVLGAGDIGGTLARKARALGMTVTAIRRKAIDSPDADVTRSWDHLLEVLPFADHVALCLPQTDETRGIIGEGELRAMKATAYIYNVGRGTSIDRDALIRALQEGWIAGAGLDVTDPEPLPDDSLLWGMPNVLLGQHTSGSSPFNADRITSLFIENLGRYLSGEPLINVVDKQAGY